LDAKGDAMVRESSGLVSVRKQTSSTKRKSWRAKGLPYDGFPLQRHPSGAWQKRIRGDLYYFGRWGDTVGGRLVQRPGDAWWKPALEDFEKRVNAIQTGRKSRSVEDEGLTVGQLRGKFLTFKSRALDAGEIGSRTYSEYRATCDRLLAKFGENRLVEDINAEDFAELRVDISEKWGLVRLANEVTRVRTVFKFAFDNGLIKLPVRFGSSFKKPSNRVLRRHRAQSGEKLFRADQLRAMLDAAGCPLKAMLLLGINCGFGNHDVATLPLQVVDLESGWISFPRGKTSVDRRCPLWPTTVQAIKDAVAARPVPKAVEAHGLMFVTARGRPWIVRGIANPVGVAARTLMHEVGIHGDRMGFYNLRHTFRTVADGCRDQVAINAIMGHVDNSMAANYRHGIEDGRLIAVSEHVRQWLFPPAPAGEVMEGGVG
jgi:integrase